MLLSTIWRNCVCFVQLQFKELFVQINFDCIKLMEPFMYFTIDSGLLEFFPLRYCYEMSLLTGLQELYLPFTTTCP